MNVRLFIVNLSFLATGEIISKGFTLVAFAYLARVLGPYSLGNVEFALAVTFVLSLVIDLGMGVYGAREVAKDAALVASMTRRVVVTRCWLAFLSLGMLLGFVTVSRWPGEVQWLLLAFGLSLVPTPLLLQWVFQGRDLMRYVSIAQVLRYTTFTLLVLATVRGVGAAWMIPIAELTGVATCVGFNLVVYRRHFGALRLLSLVRPDFRLIAESIPIGLSQFMWAIKFFFGIVLMGILASPEDVGRFGAALRILIALHTFVALYFYNLLPLISRSSREPVSALRSLVGSSIRASSWVAVLLGVIGMVAAAPAVQFIYGPAYEESAVVLQLFLWVLGATLLSSHYRCILIGRSHQKLELVSTAVGAGLNVLLFVVLYPSFALAGAACAMLISELVTGGLAYCFVSRRIAPMRSWQQLRQPIIVAVFIIFANYLTAADPLWLRAFVTLALFVFGVYLLDPKILIDLRASLSVDVAEQNAMSH